MAALVHDAAGRAGRGQHFDLGLVFSLWQHKWKKGSTSWSIWDKVTILLKKEGSFNGVFLTSNSPLAKCGCIFTNGKSLSLNIWGCRSSGALQIALCQEMNGRWVCMCLFVCSQYLGWALSGCVISLAASAERPPQLGQGWEMFWKDWSAGYLLSGAVLWAAHRTEERFVSAPGAGCLSDLQLLVTVWSPLNHGQGADNGRRDLGWCCGGVATPLTLSGPVRRAGHVCCLRAAWEYWPLMVTRETLLLPCQLWWLHLCLSLVALCCFGWS